MTREEAEHNLKVKRCPKCNTTKYLKYSTEFLGIINKQHLFTSQLICSRCNSPCGTVLWEKEKNRNGRRKDEMSLAVG